MAMRIVLVTSLLVATATLVAPQCDQYSNRTKEQTVSIRPSLETGDGIAIILGIGGFALLMAIGFLLIR